MTAFSIKYSVSIQRTTHSKFSVCLAISSASSTPISKWSGGLRTMCGKALGLPSHGNPPDFFICTQEARRRMNLPRCEAEDARNNVASPVCRASFPPF